MSTIRTIQILIKLLPSIFALRKDRKKWINLPPLNKLNQ